MLQDDPYAENAGLYATIRPRYTQEVFDEVYKFAGPDHCFAVDVATGSGQGAEILAKRFRKVLATDTSKGQLENCRPHPKIDYRQAPAEDTGAAEGTVDVLTAATAMHWFDIPAFYKEARRVLKPNGTLAAFAYRLPVAVNYEAASKLYCDFFFEWLGPYMSEPHKIWARDYRGVEPSPADFEMVQRAETSFEVQSTVANWVTFLRTAGIYSNWRKSCPDEPDRLPAFQDSLVAAMGTSDANLCITLRYNIFMVLAKNPRPLKGQVQLT